MGQCNHKGLNQRGGGEIFKVKKKNSERGEIGRVSADFEDEGWLHEPKIAGASKS